MLLVLSKHRQNVYSCQLAVDVQIATAFRMTVAPSRRHCREYLSDALLQISLLGYWFNAITGKIVTVIHLRRYFFLAMIDFEQTKRIFERHIEKNDCHHLNLSRWSTRFHASSVSLWICHSRKMVMLKSKKSTCTWYFSPKWQFRMFLVPPLAEIYPFAWRILLLPNKFSQQVGFLSNNSESLL